MLMRTAKTGDVCGLGRDGASSIDKRWIRNRCRCEAQTSRGRTRNGDGEYRENREEGEEENREEGEEENREEGENRRGRAGKTGRTGRRGRLGHVCRVKPHHFQGR